MTISKQHWCPNDRTPFGNSQTRDLIYNQKTNKIISSSAHPNPLPGLPGRGDRTCPQSLPVRFGSGHRRVEGWRCCGSLAEAVIFGFSGWPGDTTSLKRGCRVGGGGHRDVRHACPKADKQWHQAQESVVGQCHFLFSVLASRSNARLETDHD